MSESMTRIERALDAQGLCSCPDSAYYRHLQRRLLKPLLVVVYLIAVVVRFVFVLPLTLKRDPRSLALSLVRPTLLEKRLRHASIFEESASP